jgi:hypothetical protein
MGKPSVPYLLGWGPADFFGRPVLMKLCLTDYRLQITDWPHQSDLRLPLAGLDPKEKMYGS